MNLLHIAIILENLSFLSLILVGSGIDILVPTDQSLSLSLLIKNQGYTNMVMQTTKEIKHSISNYTALPD
uniref:Uncharacterized protein n=1 Tax=Amphimedon queenslandica TaxID=400682 RepID=A0A1X7UTC3_AMPQE